MIANATGPRRPVRRLMVALAIRKPAAVIASITQAAGFGIRRCREAVRGFSWSSDQSLSRLNNMAAVRARTMQRRTRIEILVEGFPFAATSSAPSAKGKAKTVWEKRISRRNRVIAFAGASSMMANAFRGAIVQAVAALRIRLECHERRGCARIGIQGASLTTDTFS